MESDHSSSTEQPTNLQIPAESVLFESSRHRFNWSSELPTDMRKNTRKNAIYQLMLDSRVELKNGGNKISTSKPSAASSSAKKRKKQHSSSLTENGLPDMANRSSFVTGYELAINSFQPHKLRSYFESHADVNISFQVDMSALSPNPSVMIYREIKGLEAVLSYLNVYNQVIPDAVQLYWQRNVKKFDNGSKEIDTDCRMIGTKFFDITVIEDSTYQQEQQILEEAIFGLASLSKSHGEEEKHGAKVWKESGETTPSFSAGDGLTITQKFEAASASSSSPSNSTSLSTATLMPLLLPLPQTPPPTPDSTAFSMFRANTAVTSALNSGKNVRSLDRINILIADEKVEFVVGDRLPKPQVIDLQGKFIWFINSQKKITRLKFILTKKEAVNS